MVSVLNIPQELQNLQLKSSVFYCSSLNNLSYNVEKNIAIKALSCKSRRVLDLANSSINKGQ